MATKTYRVGLLAIVFTLTVGIPGSARAAEETCDSWILPCFGSIFGIDRYNEEQTKQEQINANAQIRQAEINAASEVQEQAIQSMADVNRTMLEQTGETVRRAMELPVELQQTQIENQAFVAIQGITELGESKRAEIIAESRVAVVKAVMTGVGFIVVVLVVAIFLFRRQRAG